MLDSSVPLLTALSVFCLLSVIDRRRVTVVQSGSNQGNWDLVMQRNAAQQCGSNSAQIAALNQQLQLTNNALQQTNNAVMQIKSANGNNSAPSVIQVPVAATNDVGTSNALNSLNSRLDSIEKSNKSIEESNAQVTVALNQMKQANNATKQANASSYEILVPTENSSSSTNALSLPAPSDSSSNNSAVLALVANKNNSLQQKNASLTNEMQRICPCYDEQTDSCPCIPSNNGGSSNQNGAVDASAEANVRLNALNNPPQAEPKEEEEEAPKWWVREPEDEEDDDDESDSDVSEASEASAESQTAAAGPSNQPSSNSAAAAPAANNSAAQNAPKNAPKNASNNASNNASKTVANPFATNCSPTDCACMEKPEFPLRAQLAYVPGVVTPEQKCQQLNKDDASKDSKCVPLSGANAVKIATTEESLVRQAHGYGLVKQ